MIRIEPLTRQHLATLRVQAAQLAEIGDGPLGGAAALGPAFAVSAAERVLLCAGLAESHPRHATAWALFSDGKGTAMVAIVRAIRRVFEASGYRRIDCLVRGDMASGHVLARLLGFEREGVLRHYTADGTDMVIYARIAGEMD
ncbi:GNAT family N-acetyltransferase [Sphingomonas flavalba]|uniref:GNAT family N-acetyltransferase n=1 Tax=Sphingomonas flavalba TaxID=2559804 RepID=UPI0039DFB30E